MIDAIAWKFQTGSQWVHLPEKYDNWRGVYNRLRMWAVDGTWERAFTAVMAQADAEEDLNWVVSVDSTIVRAHQHAAGAAGSSCVLVGAVDRGVDGDGPFHPAHRVVAHLDVCQQRGPRTVRLSAPLTT